MNTPTPFDLRADSALVQLREGGQYKHLRTIDGPMDATVKDDAGHITKKSLIDAQMALLARVSGRYFDAGGISSRAWARRCSTRCRPR